MKGVSASGIKPEKSSLKVAVIGGGISGICAALGLASSTLNDSLPNDFSVNPLFHVAKITRIRLMRRCLSFPAVHKRRLLRVKAVYDGRKLFLH